MDPLPVAGRLGEAVDPLLRDPDPLADAELLPGGRLQGLRALEDAHVHSASLRATALAADKIRLTLRQRTETLPGNADPGPAGHNRDRERKHEDDP
jgi:hypothetical protein